MKDQTSFDNADKWILDVHEGRGEEVVIALVGNKSDLANERFYLFQIGLLLRQMELKRLKNIM